MDVTARTVLIIFLAGVLGARLQIVTMGRYGSEIIGLRVGLNLTLPEQDKSGKDKTEIIISSHSLLYSCEERHK